MARSTLRVSYFSVVRGLPVRQPITLPRILEKTVSRDFHPLDFSLNSCPTGIDHMATNLSRNSPFSSNVHSLQ
jgi:hypothetical protein